MSQQRGRGRGAPGGGDRGRRGGDRAGSPYRGGDRGGSPYRGGGGSDRGGSPYRGGPPARGGRGGFGGAPGGDAPLIFNAGQPAQIDPNASASNELIVRVRGAQPGPERPARPGYGTAGSVIALRANFFALEFTKDTIFEYVVKIEPEPKSQKARVKRRVLALFEQSEAVRPYANMFAHDGAQRLVAAQQLPELQGTVVFFEDGEKQPARNADRYTVEVTFLRELSTAPLKQFMNGDVANIDKVENVDPIISAYNLVVQRQAAQQGYRFGKNRYFFPENRAQIGDNLFALMGFYSSVRPCNKLVMVNINVCMSAFHKPGKLSDALRSFGMGSFDAAPRELMRKVKVSTTYLGYKRVKTINRVVLGLSARKHRFSCEELGGMVSVEEYFLRKHNIRLQHPDDMPLIDVGAPGKSRYIPAELCTIEPGEPHLGKLGPNETSEMLRVASRRPAANATLIAGTGLPRLGIEPATPVLGNFGIRISAQMTVIPGRELPAPSVTYRKGNPRVANGSWNIMDVKFHHGGKMGNWKVLVVRDGVEALSFKGPDDPKLKGFIDAFIGKCKNSGLEFGTAPPVIRPTAALPPVRDDPGRRKALSLIEQSIESFGDPKATSFILVLLQKRDDFIYPGIKRLCSVKFGVRTQCLLLDKALKERGQDQYLSNVALKVNTKLGGINHRLAGDALAWLTREPTMLVGIDVTHPGPASVPGTPSIAGVVGSIDKDFVQFPASLRLQKSKQEGIAELADMMIDRLQAFRRRSNVLPKRIVVFRDGVSEGQYDKVVKEELPQILQAFKRIDSKNPRYRPTLSILICGKRHHARFYPTNSDHADKNGNTRPGTVVDRGVTSLVDFDFYLQAHAGLQGTVRPTHYVVVYDESSLTADAVQQGVHAASYLYARATKAVSLVPPAYYADIVCEQARFWIQGFLNQGGGSDTASSAGGGGGGGGTTSSAGMKMAREAAEQRVYDAAQRMWGNGLHPNLQDAMFYL
ncbi:Piwi-domain-containing protein [Lactarius sanguifluus]|nr:Piwi-domain-containing protein [Lactarius sanguifluus]